MSTASTKILRPFRLTRHMAAIVSIVGAAPGVIVATNLVPTALLRLVSEGAVVITKGVCFLTEYGRQIEPGACAIDSRIGMVRWVSDKGCRLEAAE